MSEPKLIQKKLEVCASTNTEAKLLAQEGAAHGSYVWALKQSEGRGRHGRIWQESEGNLFLSIVVRPADLRVLGWIPLVTAIAMVKALEKLISKASSQELSIKWPNDLWLKGKKLGGILCEGATQTRSTGEGSSYVVVGVGLNCFSAPYAEAASLADVGAAQKASEVVPVVLESLAHEFEAFQNPWVAPEQIELWRKFFLERSAFAMGQPLKWNEGNGVFLGIGQYGECRVQLPSGEEKGLFSEEVSALRQAD